MTIRKSPLAVLSATLAVGATAFVSTPAQAGFLHRHPGMAGVGAAVAAHHIAKHHGHGILHRHPMATAVGAGMIAHHMAKHHAR